MSLQALIRRGVINCLTLLTVVAVVPAAAQGAASDFGFDSVSAELSTSQAGDHPDFTTTFAVKTDPASAEVNKFKEPYARAKDLVVSLPPGLLANLNAVSTCGALQFATALTTNEGCPLGAQVGVAKIRIYKFNTLRTVPIYNLETTGSDAVARLGFYVLTVPSYIDVRIRTESDYGAVAETKGLSSVVQLISVKATLWGVPGAAIHNTERFIAEEETVEQSPPRLSGRAPEPFLINPTTCGDPLAIDFAIDSYAEPGRFDEASDSVGPIVGCSKLKFEPSLTLVPTNREAAAASGADAQLDIPQNEAPDGLATSAMRDAVVRLPKGLTISAGAADGLEACSPQQVGYQVSPPPAAACPEGSKIASAEIDSPSLSRPLKGAIYQRTPEPGHLTRAWLVADELGLHIKIPGEFQLDPNTGQITSLFLDTPPVPVRSFRLHFKGGDRGVLATPAACGVYQAEYELTPWSEGPTATGAIPMTFDQNCDTGGFAPKLTAGTANPAAGKFSSLITELVVASGEQNLAGLRVTLPPGVLAKLAGVALCPDAVAATGDCPAGSQIGTTTVASGPGAAPLWIPQPGKEPTAIYLAGPYKGGPYSLVVKTPAQAGPFDLGDVIVRVALQVDPSTTQVTAVSDPLPQILEGIPITYRTVHIDINRPEFGLNPTNCDAMQATGTATSITGATANLADRFQVADCGSLGFKPDLKIALEGKMKRSGHPAVSATLKMPGGGANIKRAQVTLPRGLQIENAHINNPCTRVQFNADACPPNSVLGTARAFSPLLDTPLEGPVYFRSNGGERELPDIVADLRGPIHVVVVGFVDSKNARIRNTFANVPDAPVTKFRLKLFGNKRGLLVNNQNLCKTESKALVKMDGQNGKIADSSILVTRCGKSGKK